MQPAKRGIAPIRHTRHNPQQKHHKGLSMNQALATWVDKLDQSCLPALEGNVQLMRQLAANENVDIGRLVVLIESDPGLSLRLMRYINNLRHKHLRTEIGTVRHALMMLGLSHVQQIPENLPSVESLQGESRSRLLKHFNQAYHAATQAREWAHLNKDRVVDEIYLAALLHNLGEILLELHAPQEMDKVRALMQEKEMEAEEAEYVVFGFGIDQLSAALVSHWRLPSLLQDSLHGENAQHKRVLNVMLASQVAKASEHGWYSPRCNQLVEQIADLLLADSASVATLLHRTAVEAARHSERFEVPHAASRLLHPVPLPAKAPRRATSNVALEPDEDADFCLLPQRQVLLQVARELNGEAASLNLKRVLELTMRGIHEGLGLNRVVFAMLTPDKGQLRARSILGSDNDPRFNRFVVDLDNQNLFVRLLEKPQSLWFDESNRAKFFKLIPVNFHQLIRNDSFFVMSLFVRNKAVGIFYADRHTNACRLDEGSYKRFKQLVTQASQTLGRIV
jgi:HD-like signal output (HDOD) protein